MTCFDTNLRVLCDDHHPPSHFPSFKQPKIIGYYDLDGERKYSGAGKNLKYLKLPPNIDNVRFDLNHGYENVIRKPACVKDEGIGHLLDYISENKRKLKCRQDPERRYLNADFICYRGMLRMIMCSPYERKDDWCILVTKYKGNIYLCNRETEMQKAEIQGHTDSMKKILSYGFKFEQYIFTDDPNQEPNTSVPVNESEEFSCVFQSRLEQFDILYGAEMDGIASSQKCDVSQVDPNTLDFVEVKVRRKETNYRQTQNFLRFNLRKWWCQSFPVGITKIYMGLRNDNGIVQEIKVLETKSLPKMAKDYWSAAVCVDFLCKFLEMLKTILEKVDCPYTVYEFYWNPQTERTIKYNVHNDNKDFRVLPDWYIQNLKDQT